MTRSEWLAWQVYGNTVSAWLTAAALLVGGVVLLVALKQVLLHRLRAIAARTDSDIDDLAVDLLERTRFFFVLFVAISASAQAVVLPPGLATALRIVAIAAISIQVAIWGNGLISFGLHRYATQRAMTEGAGAATIGVVDFLARALLWAVVILLALDNLGYDVTTLIAGLGIGGIAIALAVQNILGDLFAALSIVLDKPFVVGDFIIVEPHMGTIEHIGLKSTRVRSLGGEQIIFSNAELLKARIRNYKRMTERRVLFVVGVTYQTPRDSLERIPGIVREIIEAQEPVRFDRAHFRGFGASSLDFEVVYWVLDPDYARYMTIQQQINLALVERFEAEGVEFAYPTQTVYLARAGGAADAAEVTPV